MDRRLAVVAYLGCKDVRMQGERWVPEQLTKTAGKARAGSTQARATLAAFSQSLWAVD